MFGEDDEESAQFTDGTSALLVIDGEVAPLTKGIGDAISDLNVVDSVIFVVWDGAVPDVERYDIGFCGFVEDAEKLTVLFIIAGDGADPGL